MLMTKLSAKQQRTDGYSETNNGFVWKNNGFVWKNNGFVWNKLTGKGKKEEYVPNRKISYEKFRKDI